MEQTGKSREEEASQADDSSDWRAFDPSLDVGAPSLVSILLSIPAVIADDDADPLEGEIERARAEQPEMRRYIAALSLIRDLIQAGWSVRIELGKIQIRPHEDGAKAPTKSSVRRQLLFGRTDQLRSLPIRKFIDELERPGLAADRDSIIVLIADGRRIGAQLRPVAIMPRSERAQALQNICRPYLQQADRGVRDRETGIDLYDVWRYFRYSWASRYRRSPGRVMSFLIRDAAQPHHPVMGITALSNGVMQLGPRDEWVGWSVGAVVHAMEQGAFSEAELLNALRRRVRADLAALYTQDLGFSAADPPTLDEGLDQRLRTLAGEAMLLREANLRTTATEGDRQIDARDMVALATTPLFVAKRAASARTLLRANDELCGARLPLSESLKDPNTLWAFEFALRQTKQQFASRAMMDVTTCGATPPYGHLLAGKLACLMMASPDVVNAYHARYGGEPSIIASQMAGRPIVKDATLAMLGTTSLYPARSSQYSRVRLPAGTIPGQTAEISYIEVGRSGGHGATNLSADTEGLLAEIAANERTYRNVNFVFGEGQSPKMRQTREGLEALGVKAADIIRHGSRRIVYVVPLLTNTRRFLLGVDDAPLYAFPTGANGTESIAAFWRRRWLASRVEHTPALEALEASAPEDALVSREWREAPRAQRRLL